MSRVLGEDLSGKSECQLVEDGQSEAYLCPNVAKDLKFEGAWLAQSAKQLSLSQVVSPESGSLLSGEPASPSPSACLSVYLCSLSLCQINK